MSKIEDTLKRLADKAYKEKVTVEKAAIEKRYLSDKELLEQILEIVKSRLVYKEIGEYSYDRQYVVVTEEMLLEDYTSPPKNSWGAGTKIEAKGKYLTISVNGHRYQHLGELFKTYKESIDKAIEDTQWQRDKLYEQRKELKQLNEQEPKIKKMLLEYNQLCELKQAEQL